MYVYLSKILPLFVMPLGVVLFLVVVSLVLLRYGKHRVGAGVLALALVVLWVASMPVVAQIIYGSVESGYPAVPLEEVPNSDCIVVLGGVVAAPLPPRIDMEFNGTVDRVHKTAELYRAGKASMVIVTAGNQPWTQSAWAEADLIRELLAKWGVPKEAVLLEGSSRNTRENALFSKNIIDSISCKKPLLVTSAVHMPRAMGAFRSVGVEPFAVSTDVRVVDVSFPVVMDFLPSAAALSMTSEALREWVGQKVYAVQGWN